MTPLLPDDPRRAGRYVLERPDHAKGGMERKTFRWLARRSCWEAVGGGRYSPAVLTASGWRLVGRATDGKQSTEN